MPDKAIDLIDEAAAELKMQIESEPTELAKIKREISNLQVEKEALAMEESDKNKERIAEIEKELANLEEKKRQLESQFEMEKEIFNKIAEIKTEIDSLRIEAERAKREGNFQKAAEIEYGKITQKQQELQ